MSKTNKNLKAEVVEPEVVETKEETNVEKKKFSIKEAAKSAGKSVKNFAVKHKKLCIGVAALGAVGGAIVKAKLSHRDSDDESDEYYDYDDGNESENKDDSEVEETNDSDEAE